jgi:hypothetical protein
MELSNKMIKLGQNFAKSSNNDTESEDNAIVKALKIYTDKTFKVIAKINEIGLPQKNEQIRIITKSSFNAIAFIKYIVEFEIIEKIILSVYSMNFESATMLDDLIKQKKIISAQILMSNLRNKAHREKEQLTNDLFIDNPNISLFYANNHAKIISCKTDCNNFYTIEGSGNMSCNSRIEQYVIDNSQELYQFNINWHEEIKEFLKDRKELVLK